MKILMIAPQPFFEPRGTPISVHQRLTGLSTLGYHVDLATYHLGEDIELPGLNIFRTVKVPGISEVKVGPSWQKIPLDLLLILRSMGLLLRREYDVIHSHEEAGFFSVFLSSIFNLPHIYDMHSSLPKQLVNFKFGDNRLMIKIFELLERWVINTCDAVITIGPDLDKYVWEINPNACVQMIENLPLNFDHKYDEIPVEIHERFLLQKGFTIVYTGTFERYQGVEVLLKSFNQVVEIFPETCLILVGGKPEQLLAIQELINEKGLDDSVQLTGIVPLADANAYLQLADILVSPRIEGTSVPLKIYTYLNAGKAILATDIPAHTSVLSHETACLVSPTEEGITAGLMSLLVNDQLRAALGSNGKRVAEEKYGQKQYLDKLETVYQLFSDSNLAKPGMKKISSRE